jgi:hypothetical protein
MRASIKSDDAGRVTLSHDTEDWCGTNNCITRYFSCPPNGGYVIELFSDGSSKQVCKVLTSSGVTLMCSDRKNLLNLIRREYKAYKNYRFF